MNFFLFGTSAYFLYPVRKFSNPVCILYFLFLKGPVFIFLCNRVLIFKGTSLYIFRTSGFNFLKGPVYIFFFSHPVFNFLKGPVYIVLDSVRIIWNGSGTFYIIVQYQILRAGDARRARYVLALLCVIGCVKKKNIFM